MRLTTEDFKTKGIEAIALTKEVFRIDTPDGAIMYFSRPGKWQHRGRIMTGTLDELKCWMEKKQLFTLEI